MRAYGASPTSSTASGEPTGAWSPSLYGRLSTSAVARRDDVELFQRDLLRRGLRLATPAARLRPARSVRCACRARVRPARLRRRAPAPGHCRRRRGRDRRRRPRPAAACPVVASARSRPGHRAPAPARPPVARAPGRCASLRGPASSSCSAARWLPRLGLAAWSSPACVSFPAAAATARHARARLHARRSRRCVRRRATAA